jgi:hypothetical protein
VGQAYVGFYWTLPVARRPFRRDTTDATEAARRSRTIRYQLELARRFVREHKGRLVGESAFVELAVDRGTEHVVGALDKVAALCATHTAMLLYVDFSLVHHWRPHPFMMSYLQTRGVATEPLPPDEVMLNGHPFDPVLHFRYWQRRQDAEAKAMRTMAREELAVVLARLPAGPGRYQAAADDLNGRGIPTSTGRDWTAEGVRKTYARHGKVDPSH